MHIKLCPHFFFALYETTFNTQELSNNSSKRKKTKEETVNQGNTRKTEDGEDRKIHSKFFKMYKLPGGFFINSKSCYHT